MEAGRTWDLAPLGPPVDVLVTNATLQWVPGHLDLLPRWVEALAPGGWFAMQVPDNFDAPSHALMREVAAASPGRRAGAGAAPGSAIADPARYLRALAEQGLEPDVWETTYQHVLDPEGAQRSPVLEWVRGTGLRPVLDVLTGEEERQAFLDEYAEALDAAYPREPYGVVLGFRRIFAVGHKPRLSGQRRLLSRGLASSPLRPFHARLTRWAATSAFLNLRESSHHCPVRATMPTSIWA